MPSCLLSSSVAASSLSGAVFFGSNAEGCLATSPSVPDLAVSERSGFKVSRSSGSWPFSIRGSGLVLKGVLVAVGVARDWVVAFETWPRVARVAFRPAEIMFFHIL